MGALQPAPGFEQIADRLVDPRIGIVSLIEEVKREAGGPNFFHYRAQASDTSAFSREANFRATGGASSSRDVAMSKALGEALERYCAALFDVQDLPLFRFEEADRPCTPPGDYAMYAADQYASPGFPWAPFTPSALVRWVAATDLGSGETVHVPAARVFAPYNYYLGTGEAPIDQPISTGLACHFGRERATISAICEVIERDAVMLAWQGRGAPPQLRVETLSDENYDLVQRFERTGARVTIFDLTLDHGVPTILSVLQGMNPGAPAIVVAGATSLRPEDAVRKSLEELAHTRRYSHYILTHAPRLVPDPPDFDCVESQVDHLNFYADPANAHCADFLFHSTARVSFDDLPDLSTGDLERDLADLVARIGKVGERVYVTDLTTPDVAPFGIHVVRAIVPGFQPLHMGHRLRSLGGRRLRDVPLAFGWPGVPDGVADNPAPHPYP